jgi:hypothetical protein
MASFLRKSFGTEVSLVHPDNDMTDADWRYMAKRALAALSERRSGETPDG